MYRCELERYARPKSRDRFQSARTATRDAHAHARIRIRIRIYTPSMNISSAGRSHENYYARRPHPRE